MITYLPSDATDYLTAFNGQDVDVSEWPSGTLTNWLKHSPAENIDPLYQVLIIDDDPAFTHLVKLNLEARGNFMVICENDPRNALGDCLAGLPDVVLLDLRMPEMSGQDVYRQIKCDPRLELTPIVVVSAFLQDALDLWQSEDDGEHVALSKPVTTRELDFAVRFEIQKAMEDLLDWSLKGPVSGEN